MEELAPAYAARRGSKIDVVRADLTDSADLRAIEPACATTAASASWSTMPASPRQVASPTADLDVMDSLIRLNVTAVTRLAGAVVPDFSRLGEGAIINIASVLGSRAGDFRSAPMGPSKAYVLALSQALQAELGGSRRRCPGGSACGDPNRDLGEVGPVT